MQQFKGMSFIKVFVPTLVIGLSIAFVAQAHRVASDPEQTMYPTYSMSTADFARLVDAF
ncbi:hypothetical protein V2H45_14730 [Tumidithrix elongata RA019]|uniref:Uncharacterized protein n=1 Tax=Tumidithrix elongata BACA0141 TaxID=2716417 RepID=A0AAW9Q068_9CYAN|nr:hypothetical protein [Tumidithrix elongata RA019]